MILPNLRSSLALAVVGVLSAAGASAAEPAVDTSNWKCEQCPFAAGYAAEAELGALVASGANASSGRYTGIDRDHAYVDAAARGDWHGADGAYLRYDLDRLGLASRDGAIEAGRDGRYLVRLSYDGQPTRLYDTTATPYTGSGGTLALPANWVAAGTTGAMSALASSETPLRLEYDRRTLALAAQYLAGPFTVYGELSRQEKDGTGLIGATFLTQAVELPRPVDYVTTGFEAGVRWSGRRGSLSIGYSGSWFDDHTSALLFANPYLPIVPGSTSGQIALPPSNRLQQFSATGELRLPLATTVTATASVGRMLQDESFLAASTLPGAPVLPVSSLGGEVRVSHYGLALGSRPIAKLSLRGTASYDGRDDRTAVLTLPYVVTDTFPGGTATAARYGQDRGRLEGSADYALLKWLRLGVVGTWKSVHYAPGQAYQWMQDGQSFARAVVTPAAGLTLTLKGGGATRKSSAFDPLAWAGSGSPQIPTFNIAPRDRRFYSLAGAWSINPKLTWSIEGFLANDDYRLSALGLTSVHERRGTTTLTYVPAERLSVYLDAGYERRASAQSGYTGPVTAPWQVLARDRFWNIGAGVHAVLHERWDATLDYVHAPSSSTTDTLTGGLGSAFPENASTLDTARLDLRYRWTAALSLHLRYIYEKYDSTDWALAGVGAATIPDLLALGRDPYHHQLNLVGLTAQYRFGAALPAPPTKE